MNKKAIAILGAIFVLIVGTLGFIIYQRTSNTNNESEEPVAVEEPVIDTTPIEPEIEEPVEPEIPTAKAVRLTDEAVVSPNLLYRGDGLAYFNSTGQLFQTNFSISDATVLLSNKRELSIPLKPNINKILWPQAGVSYIAEMGSSFRPSWSFYDSAKADYVDIPPQVATLDWMPSGDKIMFIWVDENNKATLNISDPDTNNYTVLAEMYEPDNIIKISPNGQSVLFYRNQTQDPNANPINFVSPDGKTFRAVIREGYNINVLWAPNSLSFSFLRKNPATGAYALWVADASSGAAKTLGVESKEDRMMWSKDGQNIYVASPKVDGSGDTIYKINTQSGQREEIDPGTSVEVTNMFTDNAESVLFFKNNLDQNLYYIIL